MDNEEAGEESGVPIAWFLHCSVSLGYLFLKRSLFFSVFQLYLVLLNSGNFFLYLPFRPRVDNCSSPALPMLPVHLPTPLELDLPEFCLNSVLHLFLLRA